MLKNEIYIGNMVQGRYGSVSYKTKQNKPKPKEQWVIVENTHEPIIDKELWDKAQELIHQRAKPMITGNIGIFARKVRCMNCGYIMRSTKHRDGSHYLTCATRYTSIEACEGAMISVKTLEKVVLNELKKINDKYVDEELIAKKADFNTRTHEQLKTLKAHISEY